MADHPAGYSAGLRRIHGRIEGCDSSAYLANHQWLVVASKHSFIRRSLFPGLEFPVGPSLNDPLCTPEPGLCNYRVGNNLDLEVNESAWDRTLPKHTVAAFT